MPQRLILMMRKFERSHQITHRSAKMPDCVPHETRETWWEAFPMPQRLTLTVRVNKMHNRMREILAGRGSNPDRFFENRRKHYLMVFHLTKSINEDVPGYACSIKSLHQRHIVAPSSRTTFLDLGRVVFFSTFWWILFTCTVRVSL